MGDALPWTTDLLPHQTPWAQRGASPGQEEVGEEKLTITLPFTWLKTELQAQIWLETSGSVTPEGGAAGHGRIPSAARRGPP